MSDMFNKMLYNSAFNSELIKDLLILHTTMDVQEKQKKFETDHVFERKIIFEKYNEELDILYRTEEIKKLVQNLFKK